jgi:ATP synthase F1 delta subunit
MLRRVLVGVAAPLRMSALHTSRRAVAVTSVRHFATAKKPAAGKKVAAKKPAAKKPAAKAAAGDNSAVVPANYAEVGEFPKLKTDHGKYVKSLFDVGVHLDHTLEPGRGTFRRVLSTLSKLNNHQKFNDVFQNPLHPKQNKFEFLKHTNDGMEKHMADGGMHPVTLRFLQMLVAQSDEKFLPLILKDINTVIDWANRRVSCEITSAEPLSEKQVAALQTKVQSIRDPTENVDFTFKVDKSLLGGLKVDIGDETADMSVATRLDNFHNTLRTSSREGM